MQSTNSSPAKSLNGRDRFQFLDPELVFSVAAVPMLAAIVGGQAIATAVQELGQMSEEIFRGDRLPILEFPDVPESDKGV